MAQQYQNSAGVVITAEQITDENHELFGFWRTTDANNTQGHVPDELFKQVFTLVDTPAPKGKGKS